jgi:hypothetical protein
MRTSASSAVIALGLALGLALATWPQHGHAQSDRDFIFTDLDGHLIIRFAGTGATGLDSSQAEEILNQEFSRMVHDRLRADLLFDVEPRDPEWAASMAPQIEEHVKHAGLEFSGISVECRAASCRVIMEQPVQWSVTEHQAMLETVQASLEAFIATRRQYFEPVFMITAYTKEYQTPHIKAFLRRTGNALPRGPAGP